MVKRTKLALTGWTLALAGVLAAPHIGTAQLLLRHDLSEAAQAGELETAGQPPLPGGGVPPADEAETDRLIREYTEKAGPLGPRKLFAGTKFAVKFAAGIAYDDNILLSTQAPAKSDAVTTLAVGASLAAGDVAEKKNSFAALSYLGTGTLFARHGQEDSYDQDALLDVRYHRHDVAAELTSRFQSLHDATADLGQRTGRQIYTENAAVDYQRSERTTLRADASYEIDAYDTPIDTASLTLGAALDYALASKLSLGAGVGFGRLTATGGVEEYSEDAQFRLDYTVTDKFTLNARAGLELRERGGEAGNAVNPIFAFAGQWAPYNGTAVSLQGHRRTEASGASGGEDFISTGVALKLRQQVVQRFYLQLDAGYENADYKNVTRKTSLPRSDDSITLRGTAGYDFVRWLEVYAFYERRQNESNQANFSFTSNRFGLEAALVY